MFFLAIGMYLVTYDLIKKKKEIRAGANFQSTLRRTESLENGNSIILTTTRHT